MPTYACKRSGTSYLSDEDDANQKRMPLLQDIRNHLLLLTECAGRAARLFRKHSSLDREIGLHLEQDISTALSCLLHALLAISGLCDIDLGIAIARKMELNARKYPPNLCKVLFLLALQSLSLTHSHPSTPHFLSLSNTSLKYKKGEN